MRKIPWKYIWALYIPFHFAIGSFYMANRVMIGKEDCRNLDSINLNFAMPDCADANALFWNDFFTFGGFFLIVIAFNLPFIIFFLPKKDSETNNLYKISST